MRTESRNANPWPSQRRSPLQNFALYFLVSRPGRIIDGGLVLWRVYSGAERERSMAGLHLQKQLFWIRRHEERSLRCESRLKSFLQLHECAARQYIIPFILLLLRRSVLIFLQYVSGTVLPFIQLNTCLHASPARTVTNRGTAAVFSASDTLVTQLTQENCTSGG